MKTNIISLLILVICAMDIVTKVFAYKQLKSIFSVPFIVCIPQEDSAIQIAEIICEKVLLILQEITLVSDLMKKTISELSIRDQLEK